MKNLKLIPTSAEVFAVIKAAHDLYVSQENVDCWHYQYLHLSEDAAPILLTKISREAGIRQIFICYTEQQ